MEAKELRIGNYVYDPINKENVKLVSIEQGNKPITLGSKGTSSFSGFDCLQPIPLTEEILLKCKGTLDGYIYNGWDDMQFFRFDKYSANMFELEICSDGFYYGCNKIEFLHDLQNCYYYHENRKKELTVNL